MSTRTSVFEELVQQSAGNLEPALADFVLSLKFSDRQREQYDELSLRAQEGQLTPQEEEVLDEFLSAETFLIVLKAKARRSLSPNNQSAA